MQIANILWFLTVALGPVLIAAAMGYVLLRRRRLSRRELAESDEATHELYHHNR